MGTGVIGAGRLGSALVKGLLRAGARDLFVSDIDAKKLASLRRAGIRTTRDNLELVEGSEVVFVSVKPKELDRVLDEIAEGAGGRLIISTVAGAPIEKFERKLVDAKVVRTMPNLACSVGEGMMVYSAGSRLKKSDRESVGKLLRKLGPTLELPESMLEAVTGLSGSGPAYFSIVVKALAEAGVGLGLPREVALKLASQTAKGSGEMLLRGTSPEEIIGMVSSPGGATEAGLRELEKVAEAFSRAVDAAARRTRELSSG